LERLKIINNQNLKIMKKIFKRITNPMLMPHWTQDLVLALPRIIGGFLLASSFGSDKFGMPWTPIENNLGLFEVAFWFPKDVAGYGGIFAVFPVFFAWIGAFSEAIGGIFLLLGFQTRIASFLICITMLVAIFMQQMDKGMWNCLPAMGFLWISIFYMILGSGRFGIDYLTSKNNVK
jgi:putative oxidoreductase